MSEVILYTRHGCHLCDEAQALLEQLRQRAEFSLAVIDVDRDPALQAKFTNEVPVVFIGGRKAFKYRVNPEEFLRRLSSARNRR